MTLGKHWIYDKNEDLVATHLLALAKLNPAIRVVPDEKVVYNPRQEGKKIVVISGGGGGHEPLHAAYVGDNLLDAVASGAIFASPSTRQIMAAIRKVGTKKEGDGILIVVKNYTGDILHFGLAAERAKAEGYNIEILAVADDVAVGREQNKMVGRRGLAGTALVHKIVGGAASSLDKNYDLATIAKLGNAINSNLVTLGASLDRTTVPGRTAEDEEEEEQLHADSAELGLGIHNEPGQRLEPIPHIDDLLKTMFEKLLSPEDKDRHYVNFEKEDEYVLLINNIGGTSTLELYVIAERVLKSIPLSKRPKRVLISDFVTSLNAPGFSITLLNLSSIKDFDSGEILSYIDLETNAPGWKPKTYDSSLWEKAGTNFDESPMKDDEEPVTSSLKVDGQLYFGKALKAGLQNLLKEEPKITHYDTKVGDGDCGETLAAGANSILKALDLDKSFQDHLNDPVATLSVMTELVEESMGGTSGGLYSIYLTSLVQNLQNLDEVSINTVGGALEKALYEGLFKYTRARTGGRTLIDTLQPFVDSLTKDGDLNLALEAAKKGCDSTADLKAKFGRASYVADEEFEDGDDGKIPDPGAVGLLAIIEGYIKSLS